MQLKDSTYISYAGIPVKEAWYGGTLVWQASSFGWTLSNLPQAVWSDVEYCDNGTLIAVGNNRYSYSTNNGTTWTNTPVPINPDSGTEAYNALACGELSNNHMWVIFESRLYTPYGSKNFYTTFNPATGLQTHTLSDPVSTIQFSDALYSSYHGKYIAVGSKNSYFTNNIVGAYSTDGINWLSSSYLSYTGVPQSDAFGIDGGIVEGTNMPNHRLIACGSAGSHKFCYTNDGITWTQGSYINVNSPLGQNLQTGCNWTDVTYGSNENLPLSGRYVAVNFNGDTNQYPFAYSDDGIGWIGVQSVGSVINKTWRSIIYGNGWFVAFANGYQAMSKDGINWLVYQSLPTTALFSDVCVTNNRFVALINNSVNGGSAYANFIF
jgi:hypothetical protein